MANIDENLQELVNTTNSLKTKYAEKGITVGENDGLKKILESSTGLVVPNNQNKTITENGTYTADEGYTGLGEVTVNVEGGGGSEYNVKINPPATREDISEQNFLMKYLEKFNGINFDVSQWKTMSYLFSNAIGLKEIDVSTWDTSNVTSFYRMFYYCQTIEEIDLKNFDISKATDIRQMFMCSKLKKLDIRNFNFNNVTSFTNFLGGTSVYKVPYTCEIIVNQNGYDFMTTNFPSYTNLTLIESEVSE